jgi:regulator of sigma E protease
MEILIKVLQFLLSLSLLIVLHELGHFFFAKLFKTRVEKFYLFFDAWFSIFKFKKGETEYGIGWIPLGGYVKISGMIDESMDLEQMKQPPQPYEFRSKPAWQRLLIMLGGVTVNFIFALAIYVVMLYAWGEKYLPTKNATYGIAVDSMAYNAGLRSGDRILSVDNKEVENFQQIIPQLVINNAKTVQVLRGNQKIEIMIPETFIHSLIGQKKGEEKELFTVRVPLLVAKVIKGSEAEKAGLKKGDKLLAINGQKAQYFDEFRSQLLSHKNDSLHITLDRDGKSVAISAFVPSVGLLGFAQDFDISKFFELKVIKYGFFESIPAGISKGFSTLGNYIKTFKLVFSSKVKGYESLGGFMSIGNIFPGTWDWSAFWGLTAFLSIILAFMNVLPIPALDGGHVLFVLYEMVTGRKPSDKFLEYAQITGFVLLIALLLYANLNDVYRFFIKH